MIRMESINGFIFDLDGTVYLGEKALPGAVACISLLRERGKRVLFISNKPLEPRSHYAQKLTRLGIPAAPEDVINSTFVLAHTLTRLYPELNYYLIGEECLRDELRGFGIHILPELFEQNSMKVIDPSGIDAVIVAFDRTLDYRKLNTAYQALKAGARFFATNADLSCPMPGGDIPDAGATLAYLESLCGRKMEILAGKPSTLMMQTASEFLGLPPNQCLLAGDRLETDMIMGQQAGFTSVLVLTGVTQRKDLVGLERQPDLVLENLGELLDYL